MSLIRWRQMAPLKLTKGELKAFNFVLKKAESTGLVVPEVKMRVVRRLRGAHAHAIGNEITIERGSFGIEVLCHEVAHVIAGQVVRDDAAAHNRFWAMIYGLLYQSCIQK